MLISVILSTLNERDNIVPLVRAIEQALQENFEILVIDDNSEDGTFAVIHAYAEGRPHIRTFLRKHERGLTSAIKTGISLAKGDILAWMDADFSHPAVLLPQMRKLIEEENYDCIVASRFLPSSLDQTYLHSHFIYFHKLLSLLLSYSCRLLLNPRFRDWSSGFIAIKNPVLRCHQFSGDYGEYFMELIFQLMRNGHKVREIAYTSPPRHSGTSKTASNLWGLWRRGHKYLLTLGRLFTLRLGDL